MKIIAYMAAITALPLVAEASNTKKPSDLVWSIEQANNTKAYELEWANDDGRWAYEVETLRGNDAYDTVIDPISGKILEEEKDNGVPMVWEPISEEEKKMLRQTRYPLSSALKVVEDMGIVTQARIADRPGDIGYLVTFKDKRSLFVSGMTGKVSQ